MGAVAAPAPLLGPSRTAASHPALAGRQAGRGPLWHSTPDDASLGLPAPCTGQRSLVTLIVPAVQVGFSATSCAGAADPDVRVTIGVLPLSGRPLPLKDHHLLLGAERLAAGDLNALAPALTRAVRASASAWRCGLACRGRSRRPRSAAPACAG